MSLPGVKVHIQLMHRNRDHLTGENRWGCPGSLVLFLAGTLWIVRIIDLDNSISYKVPNITETAMRCSPIRPDHWALHLRRHQDHAKDCPRKPI